MATPKLKKGKMPKVRGEKVPKSNVKTGELPKTKKQNAKFGPTGRGKTKRF